jgi:excinuclease ABC subunit B
MISISATLLVALNRTTFVGIIVLGMTVTAIMFRSSTTATRTTTTTKSWLGGVSAYTSSSSSSSSLSCHRRREKWPALPAALSGMRAIQYHAQYHVQYHNQYHNQCHSRNRNTMLFYHSSLPGWPATVRYNTHTTLRSSLLRPQRFYSSGPALDTDVQKAPPSDSYDEKNIHKAALHKHKQHSSSNNNNKDIGKFQVTSPYPPMGDQPQAIETLVAQVQRGDKYSVLRGCTGTGKTFVMAHTIARLGKPTLVLCHNKTLAAQLARELRSCLRYNHVELFVSYYNHYVPESYNESKDRYTAKKSSINDELDALRHLATRSLVQHKDVVVVASVSCIYGLGMPKAYLDACIQWSVGDSVGDREHVVGAVERLLYALPEESVGMSTNDLCRGHYHWSSNHPSSTESLMIWPPSESYPLRIDFQQESDNSLVVSAIAYGHSTGMESTSTVTLFPAKHHIAASQEQFDESLARIEEEMMDRVRTLRAQSKTVEADRLSHKVSQDLLMLRETGTCSGVENYSRHMALRNAGEAPDTLLDYFGYATDTIETESGLKTPIPTKTKLDDWLLIVDESHVALPQLKAMYGGDRARKEKLVKHGYRLPSALDNRPLRDDEFWQRISQAIFVSATPSRQELDLIHNIPDNNPVQMVIRPTFVCDPEIEVRPIKHQLDDLLKETLDRVQRRERTLAVTLTKRDAEDLALYLTEHGVAASFIHSGLNTHERSNALKDLQNGTIDCLVGVNLLREGLDLPQVSLVAVLNSDSEGFLRSETALLQTIGRAARNRHGKAILYANRITDSMQKCIDATKSRRKIQLEYNAMNGKEMRSTEGSSVLSIFDLLKDKIQAERPIEVVVQTDRFDKRPLEDYDPSKLALEQLPTTSLNVSTSDHKVEVVTDHIPSKPGVYFWKDNENNILYIGKAKRLRSRVKSYLLSGAKHSPRIWTMIMKATRVEFILTPSDRDALTLENKLIKHHQPPYNVLLKDDVSYPYICATLGDAFPQFTSMPRRQDGEKAVRYKYYGPYPHYAEINTILQGIEEKYDLRSKSFQARFGTFDKNEFQKLFNQALEDVFEPSSSKESVGSSLSLLRSSYEESSTLFESHYNTCRDVVAVGKSVDETTIIIYVLQLRNGMVAGQFSYACEVASGMTSTHDFADAIQHVLEHRHYPSGGSRTNGKHSFFPDEILIQYPLPDATALRAVVRSSKLAAEPQALNCKSKVVVAVRVQAGRGVRKESDERALQCAIDNADQVANDMALANLANVPVTSVDGTAIKELAAMLSLRKEPQRIECFDISHTQGEDTVGSRVVFIDGKAAPHLYRTFNVKGVTGPDDYASIAEVLERRFRRVWRSNMDPSEDGKHLVDSSDPWAMPDLVVIDGGKGQLSAALKGMSKANVFPDDPYSFFPDVAVSDDATTKSTKLEKVDIVEEIYPPLEASVSKQQAFVPVVALAKKKEELFVRHESVPVNESADSSGLLLLRALRDESHRFALKNHRRKRRQTSRI